MERSLERTRRRCRAARPAVALLTATLTVVAATTFTGCAPTAPTGPSADAQEVERLRTSLASASAATGGGTEQSGGSGWASLGGSFTLAEGATPRAAKPLTVNKDTATCAPGGKQIFDQVMAVDPSTRGIQNIAIFLRKARRVNDSAKPNDAEVVFDQKACVFLSHVFGMRVGQTMQIKNSDPVGHNTNIASQSGIPFNQIIPANQALPFKPVAQESLPVPVTCSIHPWMKSYLLPRDNGYFAVTDATGKFQIADLPAGEELEFQVWHENAAGANGAVSTDLPELKWSSKGRFKIKLEENEERTLDVVLPGDAFKS